MLQVFCNGKKYYYAGKFMDRVRISNVLNESTLIEGFNKNIKKCIIKFVL